MTVRWAGSGGAVRQWRRTVNEPEAEYPSKQSC